MNPYADMNQFDEVDSNDSNVKNQYETIESEMPSDPEKYLEDASFANLDLHDPEIFCLLFNSITREKITKAKINRAMHSGVKLCRKSLENCCFCNKSYKFEEIIFEALCC